MFKSHRTLARLLLLVGATLALGGPLVAPTFARSVPAGLSKADLAMAWNSMSANEKAVRKQYFKSDRYVIVGFSSATQAFDKTSGNTVGEPKRMVVGLAGATPQPLTTGSGNTANLYISIAVAYDREAPAYRWDITDYYQWQGWPAGDHAGLEQVATAWANGLALNSDYAYTHNGWGNITGTRNDVTANVGTSWELPDCRTNCSSWGDLNQWGYLLATIKESTAHNQDTNVVFKYFHTWQGLEYSISFSGSGPSIGISPTTSQASLATFTSFRN